MSVRLTHEEILNRLNILYNGIYKYDLSGVNNVFDKLEITCDTHGKSHIRVWDHLNGHICKKCAIQNGKNLQKIGKEEFVKRSIEKFGIDSYDYSKVDYINNKTKIILICKKHNYEFNQIPRQHLNGNVCCPKCFKIISIGEKVIRDILLSKGVKSVEQYSFKDCKSKHILKFDFYLPDYNIIIEYDGRQHFKKGWNSESEFERTKINDIIKTKYCLENNIKLIRIPYINFKNIENILEKELQL